MGKTMYYDNILISELMDGDHLEHHGILGMKWGIRRYQSYSQVPRKSGEGGKEQGLARKKSKLEAKKAKNTAKIQKYQKSLSTTGAKRRDAKVAKYQSKLDKLNSSRAMRKVDKQVLKDQPIGTKGYKKLEERHKLESKIARLSSKNSSFNAKVSALEYKNAKLDKRINKIDTKISVNKINARRNQAKDNIRRAYMENPEAFSKYDRDVTLRIIDSEYNKDVRAAKKRR